MQINIIKNGHRKNSYIIDFPKKLIPECDEVVVTIEEGYLELRRASIDDNKTRKLKSILNQYRLWSVPSLHLKDGKYMIDQEESNYDKIVVYLT